MRSLLAAIVGTSFHATLADESVDYSCDPLVPEYCMLPFPNNYWFDGEHLSVGNKTFPVANDGGSIDPDLGGWNDLEGFSPFSPITTYFHGMDDATIDGCSRLWNMDFSLDKSSPTVLIDTVTGEAVAHWVEVDHVSDKSDVSNKRAMLLWPATRLESSRRYVVGIRYLPNAVTGLPIQRSPAFDSLVTGTETDDARIENRRELYETDIFPTLSSLGYFKSGLLLAWDFTTNSRDSITSRMISARDDARMRLDETNGPLYEIAKTSLNYNEYIYARIDGAFRMPMYLNTHLPIKSARLVLNEEGDAVEFQGYEWFQFIALIPYSAYTSEEPFRVLQYGHGLFGSPKEVDHDYLETFASANGYVLCASRWIGLSGQDVPAAVSVVVNDFTDFMYVPDRTTQGMINALGLMQMMRGRFMSDPVVTVTAADGSTRSVIDPSDPVYTGNSEGGIFGAVYMAVSQDVTKGVLGVPGGPYSLLLPRSHDFMAEYAIIKTRYSDPIDRAALMVVIQQLWDRAEPSGFMDAIGPRNPLSNTPAHQVILHYGLGDAQVTWLGAHAIARSADSIMYESNVHCGNETFFGFEMTADDVVFAGSEQRSAIMGFDYGSPVPPFINIPPSEDYDTHEKPRRDARAQEQMAIFFETGDVVNTCDGACV